MKKIASTFLIIPIIFSLSATALSQNRRKVIRQKSVKINKTYPTVYLTFEKTGKALNDSTGETEELVWLRLHNNTRWSIWIQASGGNEKIEDAGLYYDVIDDEGTVKEYRRCHVCSRIQIGNKKSILFTVPLAYFAEAEALQLSFAYDWEKEGGSGGEPTHYVYFHKQDIPKSQNK